MMATFAVVNRIIMCYQNDMETTQHPHRAALERIGYAKLNAHFGIKERTYRHWRLHGVPKNLRRPIIAWAAALGHDLPELMGEIK